MNYRKKIVASIERGLERDKREARDKEDILDNYWSLEIENIARLNPALRKYFPVGGADSSTIYACVAGKEDGPDPQSKTLALSVLTDLERHLERMEMPSWDLGRIAFPYQEQQGGWYVVVYSEYGTPERLLFVESEPGSREYQHSLEGDSVYDVMHVVKEVLGGLKPRGTGDPEYEVVLGYIRKNKTIGRELILPLIEMLDKRRSQIEPHRYEYMTRLLHAVRHHARDIYPGIEGTIRDLYQVQARAQGTNANF